MEQRKNRSRKREAIYACVCSTDSHPTADWVYQQVKPSFPDLSIATVYRNLAMFKREGRIGSVGVEDGLERFDRNAAPHAHFICRRCHRVMDAEAFCVPPELCGEAGRQLGARIDACELTFRGLCSACAD